MTNMGLEFNKKCSYKKQKTWTHTRENHVKMEAEHAMMLAEMLGPPPEGRGGKERILS